MGQLQYEVKNEGDTQTLFFKGDIDEDVNLPDLNLSGIRNVVFNFKELDLINSCGIRDWVNWLKNIPGEVSCRFAQCPPIVIDQINMINGFVPEGGIVESFFVPYYCDDEDEIVLKLFQKGVDYDGPEFNPPETIKSEEHGGAEADIDVIPLKYFKFLKKFG